MESDSRDEDFVIKPAKAPWGEIDPLVRDLSEAQVERDVATYISLLDQKASEARIHEFLASHSYFFNGILRLYGLSPLYSKVKLGSEYETDFVCVETGSYGPEWRLIEIEAPDKPMFTRSGRPSAAFTHAIEQVREWQSWIYNNADYARKLMPQIEYPLGYVFIGRRSGLTDKTRKSLRRIAYDNRTWLEIHTLDWFASAAETVKNLLGDGHCWPVPMRALSHSDLARGLPRETMDWINLPGIVERLKSEREYRLREREYGYESRSFDED